MLFITENYNRYFDHIQINYNNFKFTRYVIKPNTQYVQYGRRLLRTENSRRTRTPTNIDCSLLFIFLSGAYVPIFYLMIRSDALKVTSFTINLKTAQYIIYLNDMVFLFSQTITFLSIKWKKPKTFYHFFQNTV